MNISNNETELQNKNCTVLGECACEECCDCSFEECCNEEWIDCNEDGCNDPCEECCSKNDCNAEWTSEDQGCDECICEECESCDDEWCDTTCEEACVGSCPESACEDCCEDEWGVITPEEPSSENACEECCEDEWLNETPGFPVEECPEDDFNEACPIEECCNDPWMNEDTSCDEPVEQECCPNNETVENTSGNQDPDASEENGWVNDNTYSWYDECAANCPGWVRVTGVKASVKRVSIAIGETYQLKATVYPSNASYKEVFWLRLEENNIVRLTNAQGTVTGLRPGTVTLKVKTSDGEFTDTCVVVVGEKELVTVERDYDVETSITDEKEYFTVTFEGKNNLPEEKRVWRSVGCDPEEEGNNSGLYWWDVMEENDLTFQHERNARQNSKIEFSFEDLALLYRMDPCGVVFYVKTHDCTVGLEGADYDTKLEARLNYKDNVYRAIFEVNESNFYFLPNDNGTPIHHRNYNPANGLFRRKDVYSDAEFLFGKHTIIDWDIKEIVKTALQTVFCIASGYTSAGIVVFVNTMFTIEELNQLLFFSGSVVKAATTATTERMKGYVERLESKTAEHLFGWVSGALGVILAAPDMIKIKNMPSIDFCRSVKENENYRVIMQGNNGGYSMEEVISLLEMM